MRYMEGVGGGTMLIRRLRLVLSPRVITAKANIKSCDFRCCCYSSGSDQSNNKQLEKEKGAVELPTPGSLLPCMVLPPHFDEATVAGGGDSEEAYYCFTNLIGDHGKLALAAKDERFSGWERKHLLPGNARCVGSSHGWLAYLNPNTNSTLCLFKHPPLFYSNSWHSQFFPLPPVETLPGLIAVRTLKAAVPAYQYHQYKTHPPPPTTAASSPVTQEYIFRFRSSRSTDTNTEDVDDDDENGCFSSTPEEMAGYVIKKIILSSPPVPHRPGDEHNINETTGRGSGCIVLALIRSHTLAFCKLGDTQWTPLGLNDEEEDEAHQSEVEDGDTGRRRCFCYHDIIYSKKDGCFYALDGRTGHLESWDLTHPSSPKRTLFEPSGEPQQPRVEEQFTTSSYYLVESPSGDLFKIQRVVPNGLEDDFDISDEHPTLTQTSHYGTFKFYVSKLDPAKKIWQPVRRIGDLAFFVGLNHSVSLSPLHFPYLTPNSIFFSDDSYQTPDQNSGLGQDMGAFHLEDESLSLFSLCGDRKSNIVPAPFWVAPFPSEPEPEMVNNSPSSA